LRVAARVWLAEVAELLEEEGGADGCFRLRDDVALQRGGDGQLACWPLLVKTLGEIVRIHGTPQASREAATPDRAEESAAGSKAGDVSEARGVLLSQLKPLLIRHWDSNFQERAVGYFNEDGSFVSIKKMKHLVAAVIDWRARRLARRAAAPTAVDAALQATPPLLLRTSPKHNDMVLFCPRVTLAATEFAPPPASAPGQQQSASASSRDAAAGPPANPGLLPAAGGASRLSPAQPRAPPWAAGTGAAEDSLAAGDGNGCASSSYGCSPARSADAQRLDVLEKESRRLRIENAELKKRLKFDSEFLHKQIRRLRIENAELKKRVFFSSHHLADSSPGAAPPVPHLPLQPVWVPASTAVFAPVVAGSSTSPSGTAACETPTGASCLSGSGHVSPAQGSLTPVPHGFCYAVPLAQGVMSPVGPASWPSALGQFVAVPIGTAAPAAVGSAAVMSPFSDRSQQELLLPKSLLCSSDQTSASMSNMSDSVSPDCRGQTEGLAGPSVQFQGNDDRWVCIPSGIVERKKAQFEAQFECGEGTAEAAPAAGASGSCEPAPDDAAVAPAAGSGPGESPGGSAHEGPAAPETPPRSQQAGGANVLDWGETPPIAGRWGRTWSS